MEAAKALSELRDPVSAPALLHVLDDENGDVRWVAGEGLIALGKTGLLTVLFGLTKRSRSLVFCQSAHHVLGEGVARREYPEEVAPVRKALEEHEPAVAAPAAAFQALKAIRASD